MAYKEMKPGLTPDCQTLSTGSMWTCPAALLLDLEGRHVLVLILKAAQCLVVALCLLCSSPRVQGEGAPDVSSHSLVTLCPEPGPPGCSSNS